MLKGSRQSQSPAPYQDRPYTFFTLAGSIASTQLHADVGTDAVPTTHSRHAHLGTLPCAQVMQYLAGRAGSKAAGPGGTNAEEDEAARPRNAFARGSDHGDAAPIEEQVRVRKDIVFRVFQLSGHGGPLAIPCPLRSRCAAGEMWGFLERNAWDYTHDSTARAAATALTGWQWRRVPHAGPACSKSDSPRR